jgi:enamine deaminase RidA (YjgF/YER057c/UK114 family)
MDVEKKLKELGLEVKVPSGPRGKLAPAVRTGNLVFTSGNTSPQIGKVGAEVSLEEAYQGAREAILSCLGAVKWAVGDLNKVTRVVKLLGMVNCAEGFYNTPGVIHGATDLLLELFGPEAGWHARSAVGLYQLPGNCAVEIELIVEVRD